MDGSGERGLGVARRRRAARIFTAGGGRHGNARPAQRALPSHNAERCSSARASRV